MTVKYKTTRVKNVKVGSIIWWATGSSNEKLFALILNLDKNKVSGHIEITVVCLEDAYIQKVLYMPSQSLEVCQNDE